MTLLVAVVLVDDLTDGDDRVEASEGMSLSVAMVHLRDISEHK